MALVGDIQLQPSAVTPPILDKTKKFSAEGLTATTAFAVTDAGAGSTVGTCGLITARSSNDVRSWFQSTKADGNVELYMTNDARPDWALRVSGTADNAFIIANSYGSNCTAQFPAFSIGGAGAVGIGKTGATNTLDIAYKNAATGGIQILQTQNNVGAKLIAESTSASIGSTSNHKFGFRVNGTTVAAFNTSTQFGIGTDSPGATLDVRGAAIFNEAGAAVDFRIEGDAEQNLFFVDGSADAIGMGTATPVDTSRLHIMGTDGDPSATHNGDAMLIVENNGNTAIEIATSNTTYGAIGFSDAGAHSRGAVLYDHGTGLGGETDSLYFQTAGSIRAVIQSDGDVGIGTLAAGAPLHIALGDDPEIRIQGATDGDPKINFYQGASTCRATIVYQDTNDVFAIDSAGTLQLQTASTTKLTIGNCVGIGTTAPVDACGAQLDIYNTGATTALQLRTGNTSAASATIRGEGYRGNGDSEQVLQIVGRNKNALIDLGIFEVAAEAKHCLGALEFKTFDGSSMTTKMKITSGGNVGVGTATPAGKFHVEGSCAVFNPVSANAGKLEIVQGSTHADSIRLNATGTTNMYLEYRGYNGHVFVVDSTEGMRLTSTGLGIGTTTPEVKLDVMRANDATAYGATADQRAKQIITARMQCEAAGAFSGISLITGAGNQSVWELNNVWQSNYIGDLAFKARNGASSFTEVMRMTADEGNIGIGTAAPVSTSRLHIMGTDGDPSASHSGDAMVIIENCGQTFLELATGNANHAGLTFSDAGAATRGAVAYDHGTSLGGAADTMYFQTAGSLRVAIDSSGDVGIGTTAPTDKLDVRGGAIAVYGQNTTHAACVLKFGHEGAGLSQIRAYGVDGSSLGKLEFTVSASDGSPSCDVMTVTSAGLGIGTSSPASELEISSGDGRTTLTINETTAFADNETRAMISFEGILDTDARGQYAFINGISTAGSYGAGELTLGIRKASDGGIAELIRLADTGHVGIGTTAPATLLHVQESTLSGFSPDSNTNFAVEENSTSLIEIAGTDSGILFSDASAWAGRLFYCHGNDYLYFATAQTNRMVLNSTGLGIGTTAPATLLHLQSPSGIGKIQLSDDAGRKVEIQSPDSGVANGRIGTITNHSFEINAGAGGGTNHVAFFTDCSERMRITNGGNVGIGTTPSYPLHVARPAGSTCQLLNLQSCTNSSNGDKVQLAFSSQVALDSQTRINAAINAVTHSVTSSHYGDLEFLTMNVASLGQKMVIKHDGKVGIGTCAPQTFSSSNAVLAVGNTSGANTELVLASASSGGSVGQISFTCTDNTTNQARIYYNQATGDMGFEVADALLITADCADFTDTNGNHVMINGNPATGQKGIVIGYDNSCNGGQINAIHTGTEYRPVSIGDNAAVYIAKNAGAVGIGTTSTSRKLEVYESTLNPIVDFISPNTSQTTAVFRINAHKSANSNYDFFNMYSGSGFADIEFKFRGDGNAYADGSFNNSGADYQEYFESTSGVAAEVGRTIVLDSDKVRYYNAATDNTDDIIGVTRPQADNKNSAVIGNVAWNHWTDKYLTDDWGVYLREDVTVWEWDEVRYVDGDDIPEDKQVNDIKVEAGSSYERDELAKDSEWTPPTGATSSKQSVRKLNPDYNESLIEGYQSREDRDEWWLIGLLGQIQVKAGEPVNSRWIKMKTISSAVDLYLVR